MDILILADFCGSFDGKGNSRFLYIADMLSQNHDVEILTSDFNHGTKSYFESKPSGYPYTITMVHEGKYSRNVSLQRFYGHFVWGRSVKKYLKTRKKPDVIYAAVPPLSGTLVAAKYCEKKHVRFVADIQDLWPEAFQMVFNVPVLSKLVFAPFKAIADGIYKRADEICAVSKTYANRAKRVNQKCKETHVVFLGTNLSSFDKYVKENPVDKPKNELWIGYCGTLGASYDITIAIDALAILKERDIRAPKFIVLGDGERRIEFEQHAKELDVDCVFTGYLPYEQMCGWLAACDIAVNPIMHNAAQSIINKHGDFAAAGIPVLNTQECQEYRDLVDSYEMGFNCKNGDAAGLADALILLLNDSELRLRMGNNSRKCAEERFDRKHSYQELIRAIEKHE